MPQSPGHHQSQNDYSLFTTSTAHGSMLVFIYVDNILIIEDDKKGNEALKDVLQQSFQMKDLGLASYFFGLEISKHPHWYFLSQQK